MSDTTAWEDYCEASLDLSNQDEVGEAGAIAALDSTDIGGQPAILNWLHHP